ncbi:MAG: GNAT family N-acetyltransferase, partial [Micromonosporaceae bacterium]|nr:GNAT family N-acetyltransferase [Micromonosporaceae bacterium]
MILREYEQSTASMDDAAAAVQIMNEVIAVDLPEDPPWRMERAQDYLTVTMPGERRFVWHAFSVEDEPSLGRATLLVTDGIGVLELMVRPSARRQGIGTALLRAAAERAMAEDLESLGVEVAGETPSVGFFEAHGFRMACTELRGVLSLSAVDWQRIGAMAGEIGSGYRIEVYPDGPPPSMFETYTDAKSSLRSLGTPGIDLHPSSYGPERLAASLATLRARGMRPYVVVALHERTQTVAALTEVVIPLHRPTRADQYDTVVVPAHRG